MSWIAEYDTQGREFPTCVHVTKTTGTMTHGATYVPIEDGKAVRAENAKLRELVADMCKAFIHGPCYRWCEHMPEPCNGDKCQYVRRMHETYKKTEDEMEGASRER